MELLQASSPVANLGLQKAKAGLKDTANLPPLYGVSGRQCVT